MLNKIKEWSGVIALIAIVLFLIFGGRGDLKSFGGVTNYDEVDATAIKIGGSNGSRVGPIAIGTCTLTSDSSITATTTGTGTCATTGSVAGDFVVLVLSTTTTKISAQYVLGAVVAGTNTSTVQITNLTGANGIPGGLSGFGSSTQYEVFHPVSSIPGL